jgi:heme a synthase
MVLFQIVIGGITRLTGSGLSITKWEVVKGTMPPLSEAAWVVEFDLYKATPQYQKINQGMSLSDFKFIYFWEYFHRLWARLMFFVFIIPFCWFLWKGMLTRRLLPRLLTVVALAGLEGFFGWIMVASGLTMRPWVNAYNLTLHLTMGIIIFSYLLWTWFIAAKPELEGRNAGGWKRWAWALTVLAFVQIALGAMMSGTKAGLFYPTWPDIGGNYLPAMLTDASQWHWQNFKEYDANPFMSALVQLLHRNVAYLLTGLLIYFAVRTWREGTPLFRNSLWAMLACLGVQVLLGILTLINCRGHIPVDLGVYHQAGAVLLLSSILWVNYQVQRK